MDGGGAADRVTSPSPGGDRLSAPGSSSPRTEWWNHPWSGRVLRSSCHSTTPVTTDHRRSHGTETNSPPAGGVVVATAAMAAGLLIGLGGLATASAAGADSMKPAIVGGPTAKIASNRAVVSTLTTPAYRSVLVVGGTGPLAGAPLYILSSDAYGKFGCTTVLENTFQGPLTCTGPESDVFNNVQTDEWPAFTTTGDPVAGPGVNDGLLGSVAAPGHRTAGDLRRPPALSVRPTVQPVRARRRAVPRDGAPAPTVARTLEPGGLEVGTPGPGRRHPSGARPCRTAGPWWPPRSTPTPSPAAWR